MNPPEPTLEQEATLHIGNDGSPGPASKGAAVKSDDWTTPTKRPRGDTKISSLITQRRSGKPQHLQERVDTLIDTTTPLSPIANHSATYRFALNPKVGSACITITVYDVLGRQLMNGHDDKGYWWRHLTGDPNYRIAVVDSTNLILIQTSNPQAAHGSSKQLYEWLGIMGWESFPVQVKYAITTESSAVLHHYTCEGFTNRGTISVIHVISPDYRGKPGATCAEVASELTQAYKNVFTLFN